MSQAVGLQTEGICPVGLLLASMSGYMNAVLNMSVTSENLVHVFTCLVLLVHGVFLFQTPLISNCIFINNVFFAVALVEWIGKYNSEAETAIPTAGLLKGCS